MSFTTISVIGLGYIGLPTAAAFASRQKQVVGVDINARAVETINRGEIHIVEPDLDRVVKEAVDGQVNVKVTIQNKMFLGEKIRYFVNDSLGKEWIIDIYDPGRTILEGEAYAAFPLKRHGSLKI